MWKIADIPHEPYFPGNKGPRGLREIADSPDGFPQGCMLTAAHVALLEVGD